EAGTYGTYDRDGSKDYAGLYTNNSAILYPVDSTNVSGTPEAFPRPTVSYTVGSISEPEPEPEPEPDEPGPIWPTFTMATVIKVDSEDENIRLSGAKFELYREGRATPIGLSVDTTDENGELRLPSLTPGSTYYLVEVAAPEGYMLTSEPIVFTAEYDMRQNVIYVTNTKSKTPSDLNSDDHFAYIVGYPDGNVRPTGNITRAEVATIFFRLLTEEVRNENMTWDNPFSDVNKGDWFDCAISTLYAMGIINGYPDGTYDPNGFITRAEFAAIAARFDTIGNDFEQSFGDVYGHWAEDEIAAAKAHGWLTGYEDGTFKPDQLITRAEAMTIVNRVLNRIPESADALLDDMVKWPDNADTSAWYYLAVQEATNSHFYDRTDANKEIWTEIREPRDWTELEK
ncbi:MAG: S-layer homology domain-containing protein, partial [Candidatus Flemingiibacterium sp.]